MMLPTAAYEGSMTAHLLLKQRRGLCKKHDDDLFMRNVSLHRNAVAIWFVNFECLNVVLRECGRPNLLHLLLAKMKWINKCVFLPQQLLEDVRFTDWEKETRGGKWHEKRESMGDKKFKLTIREKLSLSLSSSSCIL